MPQTGYQLDHDILSCSICLDFLKDPVTIPCGHTFCMDCMKAFWDSAMERSHFSCPQCRQTFTMMPYLAKNTVIAALIKEMTQQVGLANHRHARSHDVSCDNRRKRKAVDSSEDCLTSGCDNHLQDCHAAIPLKKQRVMTATAALAKRRRDLEVTRQNIQQTICLKEKAMGVLQQEVRNINNSADKAVEGSKETFGQLFHQLEQVFSDIKRQVRSTQRAKVSQVKESLRRQEQEVTELRRRGATQSTTTSFLMSSHCQFRESTDSNSVKEVRPLSYFKEVAETVEVLKNEMQMALQKYWANISSKVPNVSLSETAPKTRSDFKKYSCEITLDPNTVNKYLLLSNGNRKLTKEYKKQYYPFHPDRFTVMPQVLSRESLPRRCYWEVKWKRSLYPVYIAVAYKSISRAGGSDHCKFGFNDKSWSFIHNHRFSAFCHNSIKTPVFGTPSNRMGVYLDRNAGTLAFYSISDTMTLLHRVQITFTKPLYAGLALPWGGNTAKFCKL